GKDDENCSSAPAPVQAREHHLFRRTRGPQYLPVLLAQHALATVHRCDKPLPARLRSKNRRGLIPDRVAQPGHRRGTGGLLQSLASADTAQRANSSEERRVGKASK